MTTWCWVVRTCGDTERLLAGEALTLTALRMGLRETINERTPTTGTHFKNHRDWPHRSDEWQILHDESITSTRD